ncbi:MAG: molecular chaperone HtpG [Erysipelotrichaceae bacterium]|nr:molecular chaperone HtpG [Erysipelotrichaceae bacterium]
MAKKQFKTESKRLLDLMINSIYTNREIFLRELISNASDALDKRHFLSLTDKDYLYDKLEILLEPDKEKGTLTITDNGIGMSREELEKNLGTIAHSGSEEFRRKYDESSTADIIGQFGVGFYSSFMVADKVVVESKTANQPASRWVSNGQDGYTIEDCDKEDIGTRITLYLRADTDEVKYSDYTDRYKIHELVRKYSDYVRYPIMMETEKSVPKKDSEGEYETVLEMTTLNSMVPLWKRNKKDITEDDYNNFYSSKYYDWEKPLKTVHYSLEGNVSYTALLYIPSRLPYNFYSKDYEAGLQLYSKGVFIMEHAKDLLPDYYSFVRGLVDSDDVSLNISREILQQDSQLQSLRKSITRKIKSTLVDMMIKEREQYEIFYKTFGNSLKYGVYQNFGAQKDELQDLLMFYSSKEDKYVTLKEYRERMKPQQNEIYYCTGESIEKIKKLPQIETLLDKGYEILYCIDEIDEFTLMMMRDYDGKAFKSAQKADALDETEEEKKQKEELQKGNEGLLQKMASALSDKVKEVRISSRLKNNPVCLVADEGISLEMEKYLSQMPGDQKAKATKILEINPNHDIFKVLQNVYEKSPDELNEYTDILYQQAMLIEGFTLDDPVEFSNKICRLMKKANEQAGH